MFKTIEDLQKFSKDQIVAASQSASALSTGMQQIVTEATDFSRKSFETNSDLVQKLFGTRSVEAAMQIQMDYAKSAYDTVVSEASKMGSILSATAQDAFKPIEGAMAQAQNAARGG